MQGCTSAPRHLGPLAEDFYSVFSLGNNSTSISTIDPAGVALSGIQALSGQVSDLELRLAELEGRVGIGNTNTVIPRNEVTSVASLLPRNDILNTWEVGFDSSQVECLVENLNLTPPETLLTGTTASFTNLNIT